jgi:3-phenylpropionate/trans-cinnamate dioxygenase ferredoxin component
MAWTRVCPLEAIPPGTTLALDVGAERLLLCRVDATRVFTVGDVCTHDDGPLDQAELDGCAIECPRHGARFDVSSGAVLGPPAITPLPTRPTRVAGGWVEIGTEECP